MNQFEVHSAQRVALNAAQLRRFGAAEPLNITEACDAPERARNQLPVNSTGKSNYNPAKNVSMMLANRTQNALRSFPDARALQKEDQCQES